MGTLFKSVVTDKSNFQKHEGAGRSGRTVYYYTRALKRQKQVALAKKACIHGLTAAAIV
jgi:hypothetical protein